jgi:hypothetical protein
MKFEKGNQAAVGNGRPVKYTDEYVDKLVKDLDEWSKGYYAVTLLKFYGDYGLNYQRVCDLCKEFPRFSEVLKTAKLRIGARREEGALSKTLDSTVFRFTQPHYDPWLRKYLKEQKKSEDKTARVEITLKDPIKQISETIQVK